MFSSPTGLRKQTSTREIRPSENQRHATLAPAAPMGQNEGELFMAGETMDAHSVLHAQIMVALDDLRAAEAVLKNQAVRLPLRNAALERLEDAFRTQQNDLDAIERDLADAAPLKECWGRLRSTRTDIQESLRDSLALLGGLLVRQSHLDEDYSTVVSALLAELASVMPMGIAWPSVTIAVGDAFSPLTGAIWTRYPEFSIWALPIVGHEAGHVIVQEVKALTPNARSYEFPLVEFAAEQSETYGGGVRGDLVMRELFADFYGAWVLGAAYACSSILLRFSPSQADNVVAHHPPERLRTHLILQTLERVDPGYADVISALSDLWRELLVPFGLEPLGGGDAARIEQYLEEMIARVNQHLPKARYGGRKDVQKLVGPLTTGSLSPSKIAATYTIRDVMNAAWIARLRHWSHPEKFALMAQSAMTVCHEIVKVCGSGAAKT